MNRKVIKSNNHISDERAFDLLLAPHITEKTTLGAQYNQYTFKVLPCANKVEVKEAVEKLFKVKVDAVNTQVRKGKTKRFRGRLGVRKDQKLATVTLAKGHTIDLGAGF